MTSTKVSHNVCETTGGGKFVPIPDFPGERVDRRLLQDIKFLERKYKIFITDAYSNDPVHAGNGEHPLGLALDITPNFSAGGDWNDIDRLAKFAEPSQNAPRAPFRWVGYDGDAGHGRGNHLHLSYSHSVGKPGKPVDTMYSLRCPASKNTGDGGSDTGSEPGNHGGGGHGSGGGITPKAANPIELAPIVPETGGVSR